MSNKRDRLPFDERNRNLSNILPELVSLLELDMEEQCYAFVYFSETISRSMVVHRIEHTTSQLDRGLVMRIIYNGKNFETATNDLTPENLLKKAEQFRIFVKGSGEFDPRTTLYKPLKWSDEDFSELSDDITDQTGVSPDKSTLVHFSPLVSGNPLDLSMHEVGDKARQLRQNIINKDQVFCDEQDDKSIPLSLVAVSYRISVENHIFADRYRIMSQTLPQVICVISSQTSQGKSGRAILGGMGSFETVLIDDDVFKDVIEIPHKLDRADHLTPGNYQIITAPGVTGVIAHEAFGHTQEGDTVRQGRSITSQFGKSRVGNEYATIVNNAAVFSMATKEYGTNGTYFFDHEGELARSNIILDKGNLSPPMTDLLTSMHLGIRRTANGKRESWRRPTLTRQTNTYFTGGDKTLDELIGMVKAGYLAPLPYGGMEDPKGANLTAGAQYLLEIRDGGLTGRYLIGPRGGHIELSGYVPDMLMGIIAKSRVDSTGNGSNSDLIPENKIGGCGKFHKEYVKAGCGGPYILWDSITCG